MEARPRAAARFRQTVSAIAVASCFAAPTAFANPTGLTVVHGAASIQRAGNLLQITNSPNAIINWQSFSIGANDITRFIQQSQSSAVLNRVVGAGGAIDPSVILGALQSNGRVFLINPSGILFGAGAQIDVAGLVATSLNLSNADFLGGRLRFTDVPGAGSVINQGNITTGAGGNVYLVGPAVTNSGIITSPRGEVVLAAGSHVELVNPGTPNLRVEISASENEARNLGQIMAESGRIGIYAGLINHSGAIRADSAAVTEDGRIVLKATKSATLEAGSVTSANGPQGGSITVQSGDTTLVAGTIEAKGLSSPPDGGGVAPAGDRVVGKGGTVHVLGNLVGLIENASINASGETGGGTVLVGGDFQGRNPDVQNAFRTFFGSDAAITASAITSGDGGKVVVWSDDTTRAYGSISARGGTQSGNGGFVEVSSKNALDFTARVDASASKGAPGTLLLDPTNVNVANAGGAAITAVDQFADPGATQTIAPATLNAAAATVVLQATQDITVQDAVNLTTAGADFVAQAGRHINVNAALTTNGGKIHLEADSPHSTSGGADRIGQVNIQAPVTSNGGQIVLIAGGNTGTTSANSNSIRGPDGNVNAVADNAGFRLAAIIDAGAGGINVALSGGSNDELGIGFTGTITQILGNHDTTPAFGSIANLETTGPLVIGTAITAGTDGLGAGAQTLTVSKISNVFAQDANNNSNIKLSARSGSSFQLVAGSGGIELSRPLTTFQNTLITTSGDVAVTQPLNTSNHDLRVTAAELSLTQSGSINTGGGVFFCTVSEGCPASATGVVWDGGANTLNWFDALNWSTDAVPNNTRDVRIDSGFGSIQIGTGGAAQAKSLVADSPLQLSSGSLTLTNASQFNHTFTLSGGSLSGAGSATLGGANGSLTWSSGTMTGSGAFTLASGRSGTLSGSLTLDRLFQNSGTLTLSNATISTTAAGSITNVGTMSVSGSTLAVPVLNSSPVQFTGGTNVITSAGGITNGTVDFLGGATMFQAGSTYNVAATNISGGTANFDNTASTTTLNLSSGTLGGSGNFTVNAAFDWSGGKVTGSGAFATNGTSTLSGPGDKDLVDRTWTSAGTVNLTGGRLDLQGTSGVLTNQATGIFNASTSSGSLVSGNAGNVFNNQGTFNKDAAGTGAIDGPMTFNNTGTVNVNAGTLRLSNFPANAGTINIANGATLSTGEASLTNSATGVIQGSGTLDLDGATLTNNGTVSPGASPGRLTVDGDYVQGSSGTLGVEIAGMAPGTQYDQLVVTRNVMLDGNLTVTLTNGFVPADGASFAVIQSGGTVSGTFASTNLPASPPLSTNYLASGVNVVSGIIVPPTVVETSVQTVVATTDQSTAAVSAAASSQPDTQAEDEKRQREKKPICTGGSSGGGGGSVVVTGGGSGVRCTARGCF